MLLPIQIQMLLLWQTAKTSLAERASDERGEITATTVMIVLLVGAAVTAGGIIAAKIIAEANSIAAG